MVLSVAVCRYKGIFTSMFTTSIIIVAINWKRYHLCVHPLHIWIVVVYIVVFVFWLLMFVANGLAAGMGLDLGWQQRFVRFFGRMFVLSILALLLHPFLWAWTIIGTLWFTSSRDCFSEEGQNGFLYLAAVQLNICIGMWLTRRLALLLRAQRGIPVSEYGIWVLEAAGQEMRGMSQDAAAYQPGPYLTPTQVQSVWLKELESEKEAVEPLVHELPKFRLKAVHTDCNTSNESKMFWVFLVPTIFTWNASTSGFG